MNTNETHLSAKLRATRREIRELENSPKSAESERRIVVLNTVVRALERFGGRLMELGGN